MLVNLKGLHRVRKKLAKGRTGTYYYAWRGGPGILARMGSPEFVAAFQKAHADRETKITRRKAATMKGLIDEFLGGAEFSSLSERSRRDYQSYVKLIEAEFGDLPIDVLSDPRIRGDFKIWRDGMRANPRKADYAWTILARILSVAKDRGRIPVNPCERGGRIYQSKRVDMTWTDKALSALFAVASAEIKAVVMFALWTGQRQGDLLRLTWTSYEDGRINLRQSKTGRALTIPVSKALTEIIQSLPHHGPVMLTSSDRRPWTSDGFRASFRKTCILAGIADLHFHDLRGTAVTRLAEAGATEAEIAAITGHSLRDVTSMLDSAYLSRTTALADSAMRKRELNEAGTKTVNRAVNRKKRSRPVPKQKS